MCQFQKIQASNQTYGGSSKRTSRSSRDQRADHLTIAPGPAAQSSFPLFDPNLPLLMPPVQSTTAADLLRLDPTLAALSGPTSGLFNPINQAQLFAAQNQLSLNAAASGNLGALSNQAWNAAALQLGRTLEGQSATQAQSRIQRSPTDSTRMDCSEQKQQKPKIVRQASQRQLAPVFPASSGQAGSSQQGASSAIVGSGKSKRRPNGTPMSRSPSPAVSVITISSESGEDNKNQAANGANQQSQPASSSARNGRRDYETTNLPPPTPPSHHVTIEPSPKFTLPINENLVSSTSNLSSNNRNRSDYYPEQGPSRSRQNKYGYPSSSIPQVKTEPGDELASSLYRSGQPSTAAPTFEVPRSTNNDLFFKSDFDSQDRINQCKNFEVKAPTLTSI